LGRQKSNYSGPDASAGVPDLRIQLTRRRGRGLPPGTADRFGREVRASIASAEAPKAALPAAGFLPDHREYFTRSHLMLLSPARVLILLVVSVTAAFPVLAEEPASGPAPAVVKDGAGKDVPIKEGRTVAIEYTLTLDDGSKVQSNVGGKPLTFVQGQGQIIPGLESALAGHLAGDRVTVKIPPDKAYGPVDPQAMQEVPIDKIPEDARNVPVRVAEVRKDVVVLDFNHPLAGKTLNFDVLVLTVD
jgi:FKBP-type peptidyl-prolyl cis-trans isomerase SlyD